MKFSTREITRQFFESRPVPVTGDTMGIDAFTVGTRDHGIAAAADAAGNSDGTLTRDELNAFLVDRFDSNHNGWMGGDDMRAYESAFKRETPFKDVKNLDAIATRLFERARFDCAPAGNGLVTIGQIDDKPLQAFLEEADRRGADIGGGVDNLVNYADVRHAVDILGGTSTKLQERFPGLV